MLPPPQPPRKLTVDDLDRPLSCCNLTVREHCREAEGAWFLTPCHAMILREFPMLEAFVADDGHGVTCVICHRPLRDHFAFGVQQISVRMRASSRPVPITPSGDIVVLQVLKSLGCPETPPTYTVDFGEPDEDPGD